MVGQPKISVVIPLYNKENYIRRSIESVLAQSFTDFELIVVNDGSTDNSAAIVRQYSDRRVILIDQDNAGVAVARNTGITQSKAELVAFLDADDQWNRDFLSTIIELTDKYPYAGLYATGYCFVTGNSRRDVRIDSIDSNDNGGQFAGIIERYFKLALACDPPIHTSSICCRKQALVDAGMFPPGIRNGEDTALWARIALRYNIAISRKCCSLYYYETENSTIGKYFADRHFDYTKLLAEVGNYQYADDLRNYVWKYAFDKLKRALLYRDYNSVSEQVRRLQNHFGTSRYQLLPFFFLPSPLLRQILISGLKIKKWQRSCE